MNADRPNDLRPQLQEIEGQLKEQLDDICQAPDVSDETTGELIRLEETLSLATETAKEAVTLRRILRERGKESEVVDKVQPRVEG